MESFVQLSVEEYNELKKQAEQRYIPVVVTESVTEGIFVYGGENIKISYSPPRIDINMRKLKLQICKQNDIDPNETVVEFY